MMKTDMTLIRAMLVMTTSRLEETDSTIIYVVAVLIRGIYLKGSNFVIKDFLLLIHQTRFFSL